MLGGDESGWGQSWAGMNREVCKWKWSGDMAFVWWGVGMAVKITENKSRD